MSGEAGRGPDPFRSAYASALDQYLRDPTESSLRVAYELGREAVTQKLSVLDLVVIHQEILLSALAAISDVAHVHPFTQAAGEFFVESLSSFEMVQRGFTEVRQAFLDERRQTELSRQLSTFLADASLALDASDSLDEMLRLVAEQARELVGAQCCVATVAAEGLPRSGEGASYPDSGRRWPAFIRWLDMTAVYRVVRLSGGSVRIVGEPLENLPFFRMAESDGPLQGWLAASLTALDGSELGAIQLFDKPDGSFTANDEATLVHLAQMASAAVERTRFYRDRSPDRE